MKKYLHTTLRLWKLLADFHKHFYIQLFLTLLSQGINIFSTLILSKILNSLISQNINDVVLFLVLYPIVSLINNYIQIKVSLHSLKYLDNSIPQHLQEYTFKKIFKLTPSQYYEDHSSLKLQVIDRGENATEEIISTILLTLLPIITQVTFSLIAIAYYSMYSAMWCAILIFILILWSNKFSTYHRPFIKKNIEKWDKFKKIRAESFQHLSLIKLLAIEDKYTSKYLSNRKEPMDYHISIWITGFKHSSRRTSVQILGRSINMLIIAYAFLQGSIGAGVVYALWSWANDIFNNISQISKTARRIPLRFVELDKYLDIIDREPSFKEEGKELFQAGDIVFENVTFKYPQGDSPVIQNMSLIIPSGKKVAFVGHSGSGKSTIIKLLLRMYDWGEGDIKIGDISLRNMSAKSLRESVGYVEQHVDLFDATIKENILLGVKDEKAISNNDIEAVAHKARIDQFYHRLGERKFETQIGERGVKLSGGERQRVGIARALIKNPDILIFDEATSALDTENEKYIKEAIDEASIGRTSIVVAHRLSTVQNADIIFVMDKGQLVGSGTHETLQTSCKEYQALVAAQG